MSKTPQHSSGSGNGRGDVSFIRATPHVSQSSSTGSIAMSCQSAEVKAAQNFISAHSSTLHSTLEAPHQILPHPVHHQISPRSHAQPPLHSHQQQYLPDHMDQQQYILTSKHGHGAGGASGDSVRVPSHTGVEGWSDREEALAAELEEAKIRVAQMEKTMRWWSDCTSNWREKWNKSRNERNKAREENKILRTKLETLAKELTRMKKEKKQNISEKDRNCEENQPAAPTTNIVEPVLEKDEKTDESLKECDSNLSTKSSKREDIEESNLEKDAEDPPGIVSSVSSGSLAMSAELAEKLAQLQEKHCQMEEQLMQVSLVGYYFFFTYK